MAKFAKNPKERTPNRNEWQDTQSCRTLEREQLEENFQQTTSINLGREIEWISYFYYLAPYIEAEIEFPPLRTDRKRQYLLNSSR